MSIQLSDTAQNRTDANAFNCREEMLRLREKLLRIERDRLAGATYCTPGELEQALRDAISAAQENGHA